MAGASDDFQKLLQESQALVSHIGSTGAPAIQRNIQQLDAFSRKLLRAAPLPAPETEVSAITFLARKGLDVSQQARTLRNIDLSQAYESLEPLSELDVEKFLAHQHQMLFASAIEESTRQTANSFRRHYLDRLEDDWESAKRDLFEAYGFRSGLAGVSRSLPLSTSMKHAGVGAGAAGSADGTRPLVSRLGSKSRMSYEQAVYAQAIMALNQAALRRGTVEGDKDVVTMLRDVARQVEKQADPSAHSHHVGDLRDCWELLRQIVASPASSSSASASSSSSSASSSKLKPHQYRHDYLNQSFALKQKLMEGAKGYLEAFYATYIRATIEQNMSRAVHSSLPGLLNDVRAFINVIRSSLPQVSLTELSRDLPLWPQIFYCYRCGDLPAALAVAEEAEMHKPDLSTFVQCLRRKIQDQHTQRGLPQDLWKRLNEEYNRDLAQNRQADPYKLAMYLLLGRFKYTSMVNLSSEVMPTTEDYLWFKLSILWESEEKLPAWLGQSSEALSLASLQDQLNKSGERHFNHDGRHPLRYFRVLLISQQFEQALHYLLRTDYFLVAVHFAIALDYYGLIRRAQPNQDLLVSHPSGAHCLNMVRVIRKYTESFALTNPVEAFHYLYLLRSPSSSASSASSSSGALDFSDRKYPIISDEKEEKEDKDDGSVEAVCALVLGSKQYELLIGSVRGDQVVKTGCIYQFYPPTLASSMVSDCAVSAQQQGLVMDAIKLYTLAQRVDMVGSLLLKQLSRLLSASSSNPERVEIVNLTRRFLSMHASASSSSSASSVSSSSSGYLSPFVSRTASPVSSTPSLSPDVVYGLELLLSLCTFFELYQAGPNRYDDAAKVLESLGVLPSREDESDVEAKMRHFEKLPEDVRRNFADVVLACMEIYYHQYRRVKAEVQGGAQGQGGMGGFQAALFGYQAPRDASRQAVLRELRGKARSLVSFVGLHRMATGMGGDVNAKLVHLEALMS